MVMGLWRWGANFVGGKGGEIVGGEGGRGFVGFVVLGGLCF